MKWIIIVTILLIPNIAFSLEGHYLFSFQSAPEILVTYDFEGNKVPSKYQYFTFTQRVQLFDNIGGIYFDQGVIYYFYEEKLYAVNSSTQHEKRFSVKGYFSDDSELDIANIFSVDQGKVYFNLASKYGINSKRVYSGYYYNLLSKKLTPIKTPDNHCRIYSMANEIYYCSDIEENIYRKTDSTWEKLDIQGYAPCISPNGKYLAFYRTSETRGFASFFYNHTTTLHVYDLVENKDIYQQRLRPYIPVVRWSKDSKFIAVNPIGNDLTMSDMYIIDPVASKKILKIKIPAQNWFLN